jgi:hypothetical protein
LRIELIPLLEEPVGVEVRLLLDGEVIASDSCYLHHSHPDWRDQR